MGQKLVSWNGKKCTHCGRCIQMCSYQVFERRGDRISLDRAKCMGCGICAAACPKGALELIPR